MGISAALAAAEVDNEADNEAEAGGEEPAEVQVEQRQVLPGMQYELPPAQNKLNPLELNKIQFTELCEEFGISDRETERADKFITAHYLGISSLLARTAALKTSYAVSAAIILFRHLSEIMKADLQNIALLT